MSGLLRGNTKPMSEIRCTSPICIVGTDGVRGRLFTPPESAQGLGQSWCPQCLKISSEMQFFSTQTAQMIRNIYRGYAETDLPKNIKLILEQFTREIIKQLNEEL